MNQLLDPEGWTQSSWPTYSIEIELAQESPYPLTSFSSFMHAKTCKEQGKVGGKNCRRQRKKKNQSLPSLVSTCDGWSVVMLLLAKQTSSRNMALLCHQRAGVPMWEATLHQHSLTGTERGLLASFSEEMNMSWGHSTLIHPTHRAYTCSSACSMKPAVCHSPACHP